MPHFSGPSQENADLAHLVTFCIGILSHCGFSIGTWSHRMELLMGWWSCLYLKQCYLGIGLGPSHFILFAGFLIRITTSSQHHLAIIKYLSSLNPSFIDSYHCILRSPPFHFFMLPVLCYERIAVGMHMFLRVRLRISLHEAQRKSERRTTCEIASFT